MIYRKIIIKKSQSKFYIFNDISLKIIWIDPEKIYSQLFTTKTAIYRCVSRVFDPQFKDV